MKILWLTNVIPSTIAKQINHSQNSFGGWISDMSERLNKETNINMVFVFKYYCDIRGSVKKANYYGFPNSSKAFFKDIISKEKPDIVHSWGTEYDSHLHIIEACEELGIIDKCVVSLQGIMSKSHLHWNTGIPHNIINHHTFREWLSKKTLSNNAKTTKISGDKEICILKKAYNVIGRTDFDKASAIQANDKINYFFCNESLRKEFYGEKWSIDKIERHSIFVSQYAYPVKGFHYLLEALPFLIKKYPDLHIYTTGDSIDSRIAKFTKRTTYPMYLKSIVNKYGLGEHISFLGLLSAEQMYEQLKKANVFVSPSLIENSSNSVGEAMLVGCPVVSSFVGGISSLLDHNKEGFLYPVDAPYMLAFYIDKIFSDDNLAKSLSENSIKRAEITHSREKNYNDLLQIYQRL